MKDFFMWYREIKEDEENDFIKLKMSVTVVNERKVEDTFDMYAVIYAPKYLNEGQEAFGAADEAERHKVDEFWAFVQKHADDANEVRFITVGFPSPEISLFLSTEFIIQYIELNDYAKRLEVFDQDYITDVLNKKWVFNSEVTEMSIDDMIDNYYLINDVFERKLNDTERAFLIYNAQAYFELIKKYGLRDKTQRIELIMKRIALNDKKVFSEEMEKLSNALSIYQKDQRKKFDRLLTRLQQLSL